MVALCNRYHIISYILPVLHFHFWIRVLRLQFPSPTLFYNFNSFPRRNCIIVLRHGTVFLIAFLQISFYPQPSLKICAVKLVYINFSNFKCQLLYFCAIWLLFIGLMFFLYIYIYIFNSIVK